jgi:hypothetical protein
MDADTLFNLGFQHWQAILLSFIPAIITLGAIVYFWNFPFNKINKIYLLYLIAIFSWQLNDTLCRMSGSMLTAQYWDRLFVFGYIMQFPAWLHCVLLLTGKKKTAANLWFIILTYTPTFAIAVFLCAGLYSQTFTYSAFFGWTRTFDKLLTVQSLALTWVSILIFSSAIILGSFAYKNRRNPDTKFISYFIFLGYALPVLVIFSMEIILPFFSQQPLPVSSTLMLSVVIVLYQLISFKVFNLSETINSERIAEIIQETIFVISPQRNITYINSYGENIIAAKSMVKNLKDIFLHSENVYAAFDNNIISPAFEKKQPARFRFSMEENGKEFNWDTTTYPIFNRKKVDGLLVMCRDISHQIHVAESRLAALRSQMNPHFIFNSLNAIQHYIHSNQRELAESFLSTFAILIRQILDNSVNASIPLCEELQTIELYMKLEKARFGSRLNYEIKVDDLLDAENILVPSMLIQPYIENAIVHGLSSKQDGGAIAILLKRKDNVIECIIKDDGVGRKKAAELKSRNMIKTKSHGMSITQARLELLNQELNIPVSVQIEDLYDEQGFPMGTQVEICIPLQERF